MRVGEHRRRSGPRLGLPARALLGLLLCALALPAFALGLGQIRVKSRPGEPLLAEIPIITSDPTELQGLQAQLASPDTFRRIGLEPPEGIVSGLRFEPALDQDGQPVIRVSSAGPVQQAELTFLVEVDWGEGRLVREYSALVDPPRSLAAAAAPQVEAPQAGDVQAIRRPVPTQAPEAAEPPPAEQATAAPEARPPAAPAPPAPVPATPAPAAPATSGTAAAGGAAAGGVYTVARGDTLSQIAHGLEGVDGYSLNQVMLGLLRANPEAFIGDDVNRLRAGAVLRMPSQEELSRYSAAQANAIVREQVANWRQARQAQLQPVAAASTTGEGGPAAGDAGEPSKRVADARLEIAPPRASADAQAGTQSGASAGGEGEMLRQELQQTKETLAARDAEVAELKTRVAELERLQKQQQQLLAMKDDALASAQQRLAETDAAQQAPAAPASQQDAVGGGWWWLLPLVLLAAAGAWWFRRGRGGAVPAGARTSRTGTEEPPAPAWAGKGRGTAAVPAADPAPAPLPAASPTWAADAAASSGDAAAPGDAGVQPASAAEPVPTPGPGPAAEPDAAAEPAAPRRDRIELARAYANLGDHATARKLLQEVVDAGDQQAREEAVRVLQSL